MKAENGGPAPRFSLDPAEGKTDRGPIWFLARAGLVYGIVAVGVLSTSPLGRTAAMYAAGGFGVVGIMAGIRYGFFFNAMNRCRGGRILWAFTCGVGGAALGVLLVALIVAIVGTTVGFIVGWGVLLTKEKWTRAPLVGVGVGAMTQAVWSEPTTALQAAAVGGACGALAGSLFFFLCVVLGYFVLHGVGPRGGMSG